MQLKSKGIKTWIFVGFILIIQNGWAQNIEKWYVNMPDGLNPTLTKQNRLELLEYSKANQGDSVKNRFGNQAHLLFFDSIQQSLVVKNTLSSTFEMRVFNLEDGLKSIGIIRTICGPVCQSTIEFYDTSWTPVPIRFNMPKATQWINKDSAQVGSIDHKWVKNMLETSFISLSFGRSDQTIVAKNNSLEMLSEIDRKIIEPIMVDRSITFRLKGRTWVPDSPHQAQ